MSGIIGGAGTRSGIVGQTELSEETGTWTAVIKDGSGNEMSLFEDTMQYSKIGNQVTISGYVVVNAEESAVGAISLYGLPFTSGSSNGHLSSIACGYAGSLNVTAGYNLGFYVQSGNTYMFMKVWDAATGTSSLTAAELSSGADFVLGGTYLTS